MLSDDKSQIKKVNNKVATTVHQSYEVQIPYCVNALLRSENCDHLTSWGSSAQQEHAPSRHHYTPCVVKK
jgi:hypothetical protein